MPSLVSFKKSCLAISVAQALALPTAQAATITVNNNGDAGAGCTLREAIATANSAIPLLNGCGGG